MRMDHVLSKDFLTKPISILVIGAGGSGSGFVLQLPYLHQALLTWGHPYGLDVTVMDADMVSPTNCVRQPFSQSDIGQNKAIILVSRLNVFWGLRWRVIPEYFAQQHLRGYDARRLIVVGCVDSRAARREINAAVTGRYNMTPYWLDLGNSASTGQFVLGQPRNYLNKNHRERLRTVAELFPEIVAGGEDSLPSCSAVESLERQEPYINQMLATASLAMLTRLFRYGRIQHQGGFWNAETGQMVPLIIDPEKLSRRRRAAARRKRALLCRGQAAAGGAE